MIDPLEDPGYETARRIAAELMRDCPGYELALISENARLYKIADKYCRLLLSHLKVMRSDGVLYHSGGLPANVNLMREMEEAGLLEIVAAGPDNICSGKLTKLGLELMGKAACRSI